ncbi:MAG: S8 family serine peptidase [Bradymonadia bacterium]
MAKQSKMKALVLAGCAAAALLSIPGGAPEWRGTQSKAVSSDGAGVLVIDLIDDTSAEDLESFRQRTGLKVKYSTPTSADEALVRVDVPDLAAALRAVRDDPLVEAAEPLVRMQASGYPDDPLWPKQWHMHAMGAPAGWRAGGGAGVKVAVLDTGVAKTPDLVDNGLEEGWSFVPREPSFIDEHGHGTHVAGTIAQTTHNGQGGVGVAPASTIMPYKVLGARGGGDSDRIAAAIDDAADRGADVINMSLGGGHSKVLHIAIEKAAARGVVVVVAAGNSGREGVHCPGHVPEALGVAALGPDGKPAPYSTFGKGVEIAAPGGDLRRPGGGVLQETVRPGQSPSFQAFQGTSMATPHVAGAVAVLKGMGLSGGAAARALMDSADASGHDTARYGVGRLSLDRAVSRVIWRHMLPRFVAAGLFAMMLVSLLSLGRTGPVLVIAACISTAGVFFLPLLPIPPHTVTHLLGRGVPDWPAALGMGFGDGWIWASAIVPAVLAFMLGLVRPLAPVVAGVCIAFGMRLLSGALGGDLMILETSWLNTTWLWGHGLLALAMAVAVMGAEHVRRQGASL